MNKKNEVNVDSLLSDFDKTVKKENKEKTTKAKQDDWGDAEEDNGTSAFVNSASSSAGKPKQKTKKQAGGQDWGQLEQPTQKAEPEPKDTFVEKKKGVMKKIGEPKPQEVDTSDMSFPELGTAPVHVEKKVEPKVEVPQQSGLGSRKFVNTKKTGAGENFAPIEKVDEPIPIITPTPAPQEIKSQPAVFVRNSGKEETPATEEADDGKIKFSAGPKKFSSAKASVKPKEEEHKTEQELMREQKEREAEEKIWKEKEEARKEREAREKRKEAGFGKPKDGEHKGKSENAENKALDGEWIQNQPKEHKPHKEHKEHREHKERKEGDHGNHHEKRGDGEENKNSDQKPRGFTKGANGINTTKPQKKPSEEIQKSPQTEEPESQEASKSVETKVVETKAGTAGWGEGVLPKRTKKN